MAKNKKDNLKETLSLMLNYLLISKSKLYIILESQDEFLIRSSNDGSHVFKSTLFPFGKSCGKKKYKYRTTHALMQHVNALKIPSGISQLVIVNDQLNSKNSHLIVYKA